jgi:putative membrane protein
MLISFNLNDPYETFFMNGLIILALPTYISALISKPLAESIGGRLYLRRSMLMSFLSLLIIAGVLVIFKAIMWITDFEIEILAVLIFGYSTIIWLRHLSLISTSNSSHLRSLPASISQTILGFLVLNIFTTPFGVKEFIMALMFLLIFLLSVILFAQLVSSPLRRAFGVNGFSMIRYSLDHITEGGDEGAREVETFFESFSQKVEAHVGVIAFKKGNELKSIMIVPSVHPGPFGMLGGSDLPLKIAETLKDKCEAVLVPHGSATHDLNLSSTAEKEKIAKMVKSLLTEVEYSSSASRFVRVSDSMDVCAQIFGNGILLIHTSSPNPTDDVDHSTGSAIRDKASFILNKDALFVDAHNCAKRGSGCIYFGSKQSHKLVDMAESAAKKAEENGTEGIKIGYAQKLDYETEKGIGRCGIQALVTETNSQKVAYILFDGNNMVMGLRERIIGSLGEMVDEAEVLTTDNHAVNATIGGFNPVGLRMNNDALVEDVKTLVSTALNDMEEVEVGMITDFVKDMKVFGHENVTRLSSTVNSTVAMLKITTFMCLLLAFVASALVFLLV